MAGNDSGETSENMRKRIAEAKDFAKERFAKNMPASDRALPCNAKLNSREIKKYCAMESDASKILELAFERLNLSARGYDKVIKLARTIADLEAAPNIKRNHITEAIQYRSLDKKYWQ